MTNKSIEDKPSDAASGQDEPVVISKELLITMYNNAYNAGHDDTVEGQYIYVLPCDIAEYQSDIVDEWLNDNL